MGPRRRGPSQRASERTARKPHELLPSLFERKEWRKLAGLTKRQAEIAWWICRGLSAKEIGGRLRLSSHTVRMHTRALYDRLGVRDRLGVPVMLVCKLKNDSENHGQRIG